MQADLNHGIKVDLSWPEQTQSINSYSKNKMNENTISRINNSYKRCTILESLHIKSARLCTLEKVHNWISLSQIICVTGPTFHFLILCYKTFTKSCANKFYPSYRTHFLKLGSNFSDNCDSVKPNNVMQRKHNI